MIQSLRAYLRRQRPGALLAQGMIIALLLGAVDMMVTPNLSFFVFYLVPVLAVALGAGRNAGLGMAATSALVWMAADLLGDSGQAQIMITLWNGAVRFASFSIVVLLQNAFTREQNAARTDFLTHLSNRKSFYETAEVEIERSRRYGDPFSLAYIDLDNFKTVNDRYGHRTGDRLLQIVAVILRRNIRKIDTAARLGGDEFAVLLPETGEEAAESVVSKLKNVLQIAMDRRSWPVTFSIGVVTFTRSPASVDEVVNAGDDLMYAAKKEGKDRIRRETR